MKYNREKPTLWGLFVNTFVISAVTVGGGYVMLPIIREKFCKKLGWISEDQILSLTALGQSVPGAMAVNTSVLIGYRLLGFRGALCALLGTALPPLIVLSVVSCLYEFIRDNSYVSAAFRGMRAGVAAAVADAVLSMVAPFMKRDKLPSILIMVSAFVFAYVLNINVAFVIIGCGFLGALAGLVEKKRRQRK